MNQILNFFSARSCYFLFGFNKIPFYLHYLLVGLIFYNPLKSILKTRLGRLSLIILPCLVIFIRLTRNDFFFQSDDFAHFRIVADYSFWQIFLKTMTEGYWGFHHIFIGLWIFKLVFMFFGVNFWAYSYTILIFHLINIILFYLILTKINHRDFFNVLTAFIFSTFYIRWISGVYELAYATFVLLSLYFWLRFLMVSEKKYWILSLMSFFPALFAYEKAAFLPLALFLFSIFYHSYLSKINLKKIFITLIPFFLIGGLHLLVYGRTYLLFLNLAATNGYKVTLSFSVFLNNNLIYLTQLIPFIEYSIPKLLIFVLIIICFDLWKKKLLLIPLFLCFILLISYASFLDHKIAPYYAYTPSIFLYILLFVLFSEIYQAISPAFKKNRKIIFKAVNVYFVLVIALGIFRLDKFFLDNCFLTQFPWPNPHHVALNSITAKINKLFSQGQISDGQKIKLEEKEVTHEMTYFFGADALYLFLDNKEAKNFSFQYDATSSALIVKKRPYQKVTY